MQFSNMKVSPWHAALVALLGVSPLVAATGTTDNTSGPSPTPSTGALTSDGTLKWDPSLNWANIQVTVMLCTGPIEHYEGQIIGNCQDHNTTTPSQPGQVPMPSDLSAMIKSPSYQDQDFTILIAATSALKIVDDGSSKMRIQASVWVIIDVDSTEEDCSCEDQNDSPSATPSFTPSSNTTASTITPPPQASQSTPSTFSTVSTPSTMSNPNAGNGSYPSNPGNPVYGAGTPSSPTNGSYTNYIAPSNTTTPLPDPNANNGNPTYGASTTTPYTTPYSSQSDPNADGGAPTNGSVGGADYTGSSSYVAPNPTYSGYSPTNTTSQSYMAGASRFSLGWTLPVVMAGIFVMVL